MGDQSVSVFRRLRVALFWAMFAAAFLPLAIGLYAGHGLMMEFFSSFPPRNSISNMPENGNIWFPHRKLLEQDRKVVPNRIWSEKCSTSDIVISQGSTAPLPSGIPNYTVEIMNVCPSGCDVGGIHLRCGWFSSARMVNPHVFKRLRYDDCLVNDGKPLLNGRTLSFQYANSFPYELSVAAVSC